MAGMKTARIVVLGLLAAAALGLSRPAWRAVEAVVMLRDIGAALAMRSGEAAAPRTVRVGAASADLYQRDATPKAALLLVPGLAPEGRNDRRLVDLAAALAGAGFAVLVPDIPSLSAQRVSPENVRQIAEALAFLSGPRSNLDGPLGVAAISYAVGPALLATLEPGLEGKIDFLIGIGGYYDADAVIAYFTTGYYRGPGGAWRRGRPNEYGKWLFVDANADRIEDARDRVTLKAIAGRRLADPAARIDDLVGLLGPEGTAVHELLANRDPSATPALIDALPATLRADLRALDLARRDLSGGPRRVILLHGRDDAIIPASESVALAAALAGRAELYLADNLAHAELKPGDWRDVLVLARAAYRVLSLRDGLD